MKDVQRTQRSPMMFNSIFEDFDRIFDGFAAPVLRQNSSFVPAYELVEDDKGYLLSFDVPGIPKDQIQVETKDNQLRVWGERKFENTQPEGKRMFTERRYGRFERVFTLPADVDGDKIQAHHEDGVLHLMLPKTEKVQAKSIKIESGPTGFFSKLIGNKDEKKVQ
jgi:HSP20 family protein